MTPQSSMSNVIMNIGDDTSFPGATPLAQENFINDSNMHSSEVYGFEMFSAFFYERRQQNCETSKARNREREKLYLANQEKFHKEADKHY
ncbi:hypothetical protein NC653_031641 [Populus alba x Populus x berolinensis]|uniref:Uncharacterized protein n=1 Tax=Populus alba x Populus x berolinensis TaxID=444605 RepID=A0AAD6Q1T1_9ROSI|nr:hypothetical protein NC653_031641 [Populus alba x Populus x berolinensis]